MFGFYNIRKPPGPTSHDIVQDVRRRVGRKIKIGHAGTLDPFAEGVLVICVGQATRLASYVQAAPKRYIAEVTLGATSDTDDPQGPITPTDCPDAPTEDDLRRVLSVFVGRIDQVPPAHSAVHVEGRRAYKLARAGLTPELPARGVHVHAIELLRYEWPKLEIDVQCGSGTYIRALARDIGEKLRVGGYCSALVRTKVGPFDIDDAVLIDKLNPESDLISPLAALDGMEKVRVGEKDAHALSLGKEIPFARNQRLQSTTQTPPRATEVAVVNDRGDLIALAAAGSDGHTIRPKKVFVGADQV